LYFLNIIVSKPYFCQIPYFQEMSKSDYYAVLGVGKTDSQATIKAAYYRLAQQYHPDKNHGNSEYAEQFKEINEAYQVLSDSQKRKEYDSMFYGRIGGRREDDLPFVYYLKFNADKTFIKQFEEVKLVFKFPSEARFFKRQKFDDWYIIEGPTVVHAEVEIEGIKRKETQIHYILAALKIGSLTLESPSVVINNKRVNANPLYFTVQKQLCYVHPLDNAEGTPLIVEMVKNETVKTAHFLKNITRKRLILIPIGEKYRSQLKNARAMALVISLLAAFGIFFWMQTTFLSVLIAVMMYFALLISLENFKKHTTIHNLINRHASYRYLTAGGFTLSKRNIRLYVSHQLYNFFKRQ